MVEHEKRDIEVIMEVQKDKYNKREIELLATIQVDTKQANVEYSFVFYYFYFLFYIGNKGRVTTQGGSNKKNHIK